MAILSAGAISGCTVIVTDARNDRAYYPRQPVTYYSDYRRSVEIVPVQRVETRTIYIAPQKPSHQGGGHSHHHK